MTDEATQPRYSAFISYSHRDVRLAKKLQAWLEQYRLPRTLRTASRFVDNTTGRLRPVFRDRDELTAAADLSTSVHDAIAESRFLIVLCTPNARFSEWVGKEVGLARTLLGGKSILAALFEGDTNTSFHPALMPHDAAGRQVTPLAADFRRAGDGHRLALLKLVAVLADVTLDALIQRDAHRQLRRTLLSVLIGSLIMAAIISSGVLALLARSQARLEQQRGVATVTQLIGQREQFSKLGRLDLLQAQNHAALNFFRGRDITRLPLETQLLSARLLQGISEDDETAGDLRGLKDASAAAWRTTSALLSSTPEDASIVLSHAQSEYWVGLSAWRHGDMVAAKHHFSNYAALAGRLSKQAPQNAAWQREAGDADSNLATLTLRTGDLVRARQLFRSALSRFMTAANLGPYDRDVQMDLADAYAWMADVERLSGQVRAAGAYRNAQRRTLLIMLEHDPGDAEVERHLINNKLGLARIAVLEQRWSDAIALLESGQAAALARARSDRANADIARQARAFDLFKVRTWLDMPPDQRPPLSIFEATLGNCAVERAKPHNAEAGELCTILQARLRASRTGDRISDVAATTSCKPTLSERWNLDFCAERMRAHYARGEPLKGR